MSDAEELAQRRVLFLSPHPDDVAYSCGGLVAGWLRRRDAHVLTVFSRSRFVALKRLRHLDAGAISELRLEEDRSYCRDNGLGHLCGGLPDASLSGYDDRSEMQASLDGDARLPQASAVISAAFDRLRPSVVIAPAAVGSHIDHLIVHHAARRLPAPRLLFFEDLPYAALQGCVEVEAELRRRGLVPSLSCDIALPAKIAGMRIYQSQTESEDEELIERHARAPARPHPREQLWREQC